MPGVGESTGWGPARPPRKGALYWVQRPPVQIGLLLFCLVAPPILGSRWVTVGLVFAVLVAIRVFDQRVQNPGRGPAPDLGSATDPLRVIREYIQRMGGGPYLGLTKGSGWRQARSERALLLLGPPRSGRRVG